MSEEPLSYYALNREKCLAQAKEYRLKNREKYREYWKTYYVENKQELSAKRTAYARKHRERIYKNNREKYYPKHQAKKKEKPPTPDPCLPIVFEKIESRPTFTFLRSEGSFCITWD